MKRPPHKASERIAKTILTLQKKGVKSVQDLISIPTINPPGDQYETCAKYLAEKLSSLGLKTRCIRVPWSEQRKLQPERKNFPRWNVIGRYDVGAKQTLHFNAHYDVVPVSGKWRFGPFEPKVKDGWIYGRGSADMKGSIGSCLLALEALIRNDLTPSVNIEVSFTADEETGGQLGSGYIVRRGLVQADYAVVMEGGKKNLLGLGHNGVLWMEAKLRGKPAHGAWPDRGINAFEGMNALSTELFLLREKLRKRAFASAELESRHPTLNIGGVLSEGAGSKINTVSSECSFSIDRRLVPNESLASARQEILQAAKRAKRKFPKLAVQFETINGIDACLTSPETHLARTAAQAISSVLAKPVKYELCRGFTDLHYFVNDGGMTGIGYGPNGENYHGVDERTPVQEILRAANVYAELMLRL